MSDSVRVHAIDVVPVGGAPPVPATTTISTATDRKPTLTAFGPRILVRQAGGHGSTRDLHAAAALPKYTLPQSHAARQLWNAGQVVLTIAYAILCPLRLCLGTHSWQPTILADYFIADVFFLLTLALNLFVFVPPHITELRLRADLAKVYLAGGCTSRFRVAADLLATIPIDIIGFFAPIRSGHGSDFTVVYALRMFKLLHVIAVLDVAEHLPTSWPTLEQLRIGSVASSAAPEARSAASSMGVESIMMTRRQKQRVADLDSTKAVNSKTGKGPDKGLTMTALRNIALQPLSKVMVAFVFLLHLYACLWALLTSSSRVSTQLGEVEPPPQRYLEALYFAATTMACVGYGDITPQNTNEVALTMLMELSGFLCIGGFIALTVPLLAQSTEREFTQQDQIAAWQEVFDDNAIPVDVRNRITDYHNYLAKRQHSAPEEALLADDHLLPQRYRADICMHIVGPTLLKLPFLCQTQNGEFVLGLDGAPMLAAPLGLVRAMACHMRPTTYCAGDIILFCGQRNSSLHIIARGEVACVTLTAAEDSTHEVVETSAPLTESYFGLESFLHPEVLVHADYQVIEVASDRLRNNGTQSESAALAQRNMTFGTSSGSNHLHSHVHSHPLFRGTNSHSSYCDVFSLSRDDYSSLSRPYPSYTLAAMASRDESFDADAYAAERAELAQRKADAVKRFGGESKEDHINAFLGANPLVAVGMAVQEQLAAAGEFGSLLPMDPAAVAMLAPAPYRPSGSQRQKVLMPGQTAGHRRRRQSSVDVGQPHNRNLSKEKLLAHVLEMEETERDEEDGEECDQIVEEPSHIVQEDAVQELGQGEAEVEHPPQIFEETGAATAEVPTWMTPADEEALSTETLQDTPIYEMNGVEEDHDTALAAAAPLSEDEGVACSDMNGLSSSNGNAKEHSHSHPSHGYSDKLESQRSWLMLLFFDRTVLVDYTSSFRKLWDGVIFVLLMYTFIIVPIDAAFMNMQLRLMETPIPYARIILSQFSKSSTSLIEYTRIDEPALITLEISAELSGSGSPSHGLSTSCSSSTCFSECESSNLRPRRFSRRRRWKSPQMTRSSRCTSRRRHTRICLPHNGCSHHSTIHRPGMLVATCSNGKPSSNSHRSSGVRIFTTGASLWTSSRYCHWRSSSRSVSQTNGCISFV